MNIKDKLLQAKKHVKALDKEINEIGELFGYHLKYDGAADRIAKIIPTKRVVKHNRKYLSGAIVHGERAEEARTKLREMVEKKNVEWVSKNMGQE
ncbi:MAG: hypothetical protein IIB82_16435, partial [Bacteroidetes bacterium]|nr:hypothetical protein [Bacteroidota bacterium]